VGTYYRYVNYTRQEFVALHGLRSGGDKEDAALRCAPALLYLITRPDPWGDGYRGRWASEEGRPERTIGMRTGGSIAWSRVRPIDDVRVVSDVAYDFGDMEEQLLNITPGVLQSMRDQVPALVADYHPGVHDVALVQRVLGPGALHRELADPVSASCRCGWSTGPLRGEDRETVLEHAVAAHVNG